MALDDPNNQTVFESEPRPRAEKFIDKGERPWLDGPEAEQQIADRLAAGELSNNEAELCRSWRQKGYLILPQAIEPAVLDSVWDAYERAVRDDVIPLQAEAISPKDPFPGRGLDPHLRVPEVCRVMRHPTVLHWVGLLLGREPAPFQTIASHKGSQQAAHSDAIHMTTHPLGFLVACWVAFEDIHPNSGPLVYYPGSHLLRYVFSKDLGIKESDFDERGYRSYHDLYEPHIRALISKNEFPPHHFHAKKGDVLFWHSNLLHGGSLRKNPALSRRALVCHYFGEGVLCYHDLSAAKPRPFSGTCLVEQHQKQEAAQ